jgi:hypothetical protein
MFSRPPAAPRISFNEQIQPILSENCYTCHGADSNARKAQLRLDRPEDAFAERKGGPAIVKGDPAHSPLIQRLLSRDPEVVMPPPESHKLLKPGEVALLREWVAQGAVYQPHWAFVAPTRPERPVTRQMGWARNPIDDFVLAKLERESLTPSPEAERSALLRRVTYDLTGLPPSPAEIRAFLSDPSPTAYETVVDRLLANPRYGEHRAHYWLDYARYGDSHGLHRDEFRSIWPYRDYVIRSFNANKPFDQFTREQLAGDLLPARNLDQQLASAFVRAGISSGEGGSIVEELRVNNQRERVETYGAVYLGLTTGCAACHDHKFDPLTQRDHYALTAFFNNLDENPSNDDRPDWPPFIRLPPAAERARYDALLARRAAVQVAMQERRRLADQLIAPWLARDDRPRPVDPAGLRVRLWFNEQKGATFSNSAPFPFWPTVTATGGAPVWGEETWFWPSFRMETSTRLELPQVGDVERTDSFTVGSWIMPRLETTASSSAEQGTILGKVDAERGGRGWELAYEEGRLLFRLVHEGGGDLIAVVTATPVLARGRWNHVLATYDGSGRAAGVRLYVDGARQALVVKRDALTGTIRTAAPFLLGESHPHARPLRQTRFQDLRYYERALGAEEASRLAREDYVAALAARPAGSWSEDEAKALTDFYFSERDPVMRELRDRMAPIDAELAALTKDGEVALVSAETSRLAYADVLDRGVYSARKERIRPRTPGFLPPMPADAPRDRLGLAEWTVSASNPLTARVTVNRMWAELFGTGLVETTEDFGVVGARPTHPQLLDWLAVEFRESGWDLKHVYRLIVTSATYRQSARVTPALLDKDPRNRLLARGPRFRIDAEEIRDTALAISGLLSEQIGGPSTRPYQPAGIWENAGIPDRPVPGYVRDVGAGLYRRSVYTYWRRTALMPNMDAFDAAVRDSACTRRQRTNTPLQALVTMNDEQWLEAARCTAENLVVRSIGDDGARLDQLGEQVLSRPWSAPEKSILLGELGQFRSTYRADPGAAVELLKVGASPRRADLPPPEVAAWMLVASTAMNLDAALNK